MTGGLLRCALRPSADEEPHFGIALRVLFDRVVTTFPIASGGIQLSATIDMTLNELIEEFEFLGDWEDRCDFLIDLGFDLPKLPADAKIEANRVHGCQSNVWLVADLNEEASPPVIEFIANSDAMIVNGLIAVLMMIYNGKSPDEILNTDVEKIFHQLELDRHLSSQRRNGLFGMVTRLREIAREAQMH